MAVMMFSVSVGRSFSDRCETGVAHQHSVVVICVASDDEIGFIIKAALAFAAKSETVLAPFHREGSNFITSSIVGVFVVVVTGENTLCGLGPVVSVGSSQVHRSSHCLCVFVSGGKLSSAEYQKKHFNFIQITYNPHRSGKK
jgi:hypothetical protein